MKRTVTLLLTTLMSIMPSVADNVLSIMDFEIKPEEEKWVEVTLQNTDLIANLQMSLILPHGLHVTTVSCGDYIGVTLPNKWDATEEKDMGSTWEVLTNKSDGLYNIMLVSGIARHKNEDGNITDFGIQNPYEAVPILKLRIYADASFDSGSIGFFDCLGASVNQLSIPIDGIFPYVCIPTICDIKTTKNDGCSNVYNLTGQKVNESYKGIVIKNNKTTIIR